MASNVGIANRALQKVGAARITDFLQDKDEAKAVNAAYDYVRDAVLRAHPWNFAKKRAALTASTDTPAWGFALQYPLPTDFLRLVDIQDSEAYDYKVEGRMILTDQAAPIYISYVARITDPNFYDPLFIEALASRLAMELCESLTQSNAKRQLAQQEYAAALSEARRIDGLEDPPEDNPDIEPWLLARL